MTRTNPTPGPAATARGLPAPVFSRPDPAALAQLERLPEILAEVFPMSGADKRHLPQNVALLSETLTSRRGRLADRSYWTSPALTGAYLWYFMPWNLIRLMGLLPGLHLELAPGSKILDIGSGPLALPLALWLSRPDLRSLPLRFTCLDSAAAPLRLGRAIFQALAGPDSPWQIQTVPEALFRALPRQDRDFSLLTACNMLNELKATRQLSLGLIMERQTHDLAGHLKIGGQLLIVEPGNRLGGKIITLTRHAALARGLVARGPCPHQAACPLLGGQGGRTWCHFTFGSEDAPRWLEDLSADAGLGKSGLSLAPLLLSPVAAPEVAAGQEQGRKTSGSMKARVLTAPFAVPGLAGRGRYACAACGLLLLEDAEGLPSGSLLEVQVPPDARRDAKSGARIVRRPGSGALPAGHGSAYASPAAPAEGTPRPARPTRPGQSAHTARRDAPARPAARRPSSERNSGRPQRSGGKGGKKA